MTRIASEAGDAVLEFIVLAIAVMLPLAGITASAMTVQAAGVASSHAVREAARAFMLASDVTDGRRRAQAAASIALADQGFVLPPDALSVSCESCLDPGSTVIVTVDWHVPLAGASALTVPIHAQQTVRIDDYR